MKLCVICFAEIPKGQELRYPGWGYYGEKFVHRICLLNKVAELCEDERYDRILRFLIDYEEKKAPQDHAINLTKGSADVVWEREDVNLSPQEFKKLLDSKVVAVIFSSRGGARKTCSLAQREVIREFLNKKVEAAPAVRETTQVVAAMEIDESIFEPVIGYDDVKRNLSKALKSGVRQSWLFEGMPATAKSLFLMCVEAAFGGKCYYVTGSRTTGAGLTQALMNYEPKVLLIDEIDKVPQDALSVLLSVMETGDVIQTKHNRHQRVKVETIVIAACNSSRRLPPELLSRFKPYHIKFKPYTRDEFIRVCEGFLSKFEGIDGELGRYIGEKVYDELKDADVRGARGIARMLQGKTRDEVDEQIEFIKRYR
jgi:Holliday junction DNA helicase RuvB